jgi:hypothetical protein
MIDYDVGKNPVTICKDYLDLMVKGNISKNLANFLTEQVSNSKTLQNSDETCQALFESIENELVDKIIPLSEQVILYFTEIRALVKS